MIPVLGLSAYASFSGDERERGIVTQEQRKSSKRDARGRALAGLSTPKPEMEKGSCKTEDQHQLESIAWFISLEAAAKT
ncbi:MAG: hypothetical protein LPK03_08100 [Pontibacter sp.]|nr:hypothetical protein [Pontibacter sp.]